MAAVSTDLHAFIASPARAERAPGFFARLVRTVQDAQMRAAERRVAQFIALRGGRMTDSLEREIERSFI